MRFRLLSFGLLLLLPGWLVAAEPAIDFNRDIRPVLSNRCLLCHGPDETGLEAGLRLDVREIATGELDSGYTAIVPGDPESSELMARITSDDTGMRMPPEGHGKPLSEAEIDRFRRWIADGAPFAPHWSYVPPARPDVPTPDAQWADWPVNPVDAFVLERMRNQGLEPSPPADRAALARRVYLDLTGLPPTIAEVEAFVASDDAGAYEQLVDDLLRRPAFGEHWARKWLDLARYADSAGYADDRPRTIWAYRDWVIRAINDNMPFDQFTREQLAGDLLAEPTEPQLVATAFHRNTLTNSEGGTIDEEFRSAAVVDRVNTTMAVWMGTTMACAQCHTHKYDPLTQKEYFQLYAIFNNTADADRTDESPTLPLYTPAQRTRRDELQAQIAELQRTLAQDTPALQQQQAKWETALRRPVPWQVLTPSGARRQSGQPISAADDGVITATEATETDRYTIELPLNASADDPLAINGLRLEVLPQPELGRGSSGIGGGNFVLTSVRAELVPQTDQPLPARYVRVTNLGENQLLSLAEVQVFGDGNNIAVKGTATQHSTAFDGPAEYAIDGNTDGEYTNKSVTHTAKATDPWWEVDLGSDQAIEQVVVWNRTDGDLEARLKNYRVSVLDVDRDVLWEQTIAEAPRPSQALAIDGTQTITLASAVADHHQAGFEPGDVLTGATGSQDGWAIGASTQPHALVLAPAKTITVDAPATLRITMQHRSPHKRHLLGRFRWSHTASEIALDRASLPGSLLAVLDQDAEQRTGADAAELATFFRRHVAASLSTVRQQLARKQKQLDAIKPATSVPVMRELTENRRETHLQHRGSYLSLGEAVEPGVPEVFHDPPTDRPLDRLALAQWLTDGDNPLTARVLANRYWETLFGRGLVVTSEEFGSQGELPTHPELLDWLATELIDGGWDRKAFLRMLVLSATYRQSAKVPSPDPDPGNIYLARGPRVRLSAEMVRDQALFAAGLLSPKMYGPPVKPPQPSSGLKAAFGSTTDWQTSTGEDRYRRGLYTMWRRSSPYPSMATFDAPNREVCTVRRNSTNTPLQSLVTMNDPVYVEASQSLARMALTASEDLTEQLTLAFRRCVLRTPAAAELDALAALYQDSLEQLQAAPADAVRLATDPLGPLPADTDPATAAAMTVVANVLLNLDEMFLKR
ncbi:DUF1553 domain-containing protein [Roseimaritima sediminicola]|uniref:DUF1553 domain-containing protein n=1 Tax=Roseimaritima sediminicola TaxID=2662066 RepID=UPI0012984C58|nr:DUF1553 domain-containing protein [Roseimaritima sediminicola]